MSNLSHSDVHLRHMYFAKLYVNFSLTCGLNIMLFFKSLFHYIDFSGFFNCLGKDGKVYDELKYVWLQGRQVRAFYVFHVLIIYLYNNH